MVGAALSEIGPRPLLWQCRYLDIWTPGPGHLGLLTVDECPPRVCDHWLEAEIYSAAAIMAFMAMRKNLDERAKKKGLDEIFDKFDHNKDGEKAER